MLGWCELDLVHVWPKFWHGCLPASPYPINTIRQLFTDRAAPPKVTAPTGIQVVAANIRHGSRIFSLLSLLFHMLTGECLLRIQTAMVDVRLLISDEYSFLSVETIKKLNRRLYTIFPRSKRSDSEA